MAAQLHKMARLENDFTPSAFVIMPFTEEMEDVYLHIIKPSLEEAGFSVSRADEILNQRSILEDVVTGIAGSDLLVADLTGGNPNVYYELGVAHALEKPTIHLAQSIEEVPFDINHYRIIEYTTYFSGAIKARERLLSYARGFLEGKVSFSNPVRDFRRNPQSETDDPEITGGLGATVADPEETDESGVYDWMVEVEIGYQSLTKIIEGISANTQEMNQDLSDANQRITHLSSNPNNSSPRAYQSALRRLADDISPWNDQMELANPEFKELVLTTYDHLERVLSQALEHSEQLEPELIKMVLAQRELRGMVLEGKVGFLGMLNSVDQLPSLERHFNRQRERMARELRTFIESTDLLDASILRILNMVDLGDESGKDVS